MCPGVLWMLPFDAPEPQLAPACSGRGRCLHRRCRDRPTVSKLSARWSIRFEADSVTGDSVAFLLNRGFALSSLSGRERCRTFLDATRWRQLVTVRFAPRLAPRRAGTHRSRLFRCAGVRLRQHQSDRAATWVELGLDSYWLPVFADYRKRIAGQVKIDLPPGWNAVASGNIKRDGNRLVLTTGIPLIDIAFSASPTFAHTDASNASVFWTRRDSATLTAFLRLHRAVGSI